MRSDLFLLSNKTIQHIVFVTDPFVSFSALDKTYAKLVSFLFEVSDNLTR